MVQSLQLLVQVLCICALRLFPVVSSATISTDKAALLAFKALVSSDQGLLATWTNTSDPCRDAWLGIFCDCFNLHPDTQLSDCGIAKIPSFEDAVVALDLGDLSLSKGLQLTGQLAPELGSLAQMQILRLDGHKLQVCVQ